MKKLSLMLDSHGSRIGAIKRPEICHLQVSITIPVGRYLRLFLFDILGVPGGVADVLMDGGNWFCTGVGGVMGLKPDKISSKSFLSELSLT